MITKILLLLMANCAEAVIESASSNITSLTPLLESKDGYQDYTMRYSGYWQIL
jgi:hypothetical protein